MRRSNVVGTATTLRARQSAVQILVGKTDLSLLQSLQTFSVTHQGTYLKDTRVISEGKAAGSWSPHSTLPSDEVKNEWSYAYFPSTCPYDVDTKNSKFCVILSYISILHALRFTILHTCTRNTQKPHACVYRYICISRLIYLFNRLYNVSTFSCAHLTIIQSSSSTCFCHSSLLLLTL